MIRTIRVLLALLALCGNTALAEVTKVTITSRTPVADGQTFGDSGAYERLSGSIEFQLDPKNPRNQAIVDLDRAALAADGKVHFTADLYVLQPVQAARGNGALLFEISNRGTKGLLSRFNRATATNDPVTAADLGDGFLLREGYTLVWVGWQFDVAPPGLRVEAPAADVTGRAKVSFVPNEAQSEYALNDLPAAYAPVDPADLASTLTVRDLFWQQPTALPRSAWRFGTPTPTGRQRITLDSGFQPGRIYEIEFAATGSRVAGVGMAAIRDAAAAFRTRTDLPVRGKHAYVFGISQSGRFLRNFLHDGFNVDERGRKAFDLVWPHIAGAAQGAFNERFANPGYSSFPATRFPYTDADEADVQGRRDGLLSRYTRAQRPKLIYTNTPVEYWGQARASALTHTSVDGKRDLKLPDNVRMYLLAGTQHGEAPLPPAAGAGQALGNPMPQTNVMRALLRAGHRWVVANEAPPASRIPRLADGTLTTTAALRFPALPGVGDPRVIEGPAPPLPLLVPQTDADGNELAGIRVPEQLVPLATTTGWNFRAPRIGNPTTTVALLGAYFPFARTQAERAANHDPRPSIAERYADRSDYLRRIRDAANALAKERYYLAADVDEAVERAGRHWDWAVTHAPSAASPSAPSALEILQKSVAFPTLPGTGQIPAYAQYLRGVLLAAGYAPDEIRIEPLGEGAEATVTLTARYPGRDRGKKPLVLIAHMDVVPARREDWERDPFVAVVENGYVFGRGVKDNKFDLSMMVATLAKLRLAGFQPDRDVVLALTGDEETTGKGATRLAQELGNAEFVLNGDSGGGRLAEDGSGPLTYTLQGGEKTSINMTVTVTDPGGHASRPTQTNAIYILARALARIDAYRFPLQSNELTTAFFKTSAPVTPGELGALMRRYVANPKDAAAVEGLARRPDLVGQLRTTCVATQVEAGHARNALPQRATANLNCRLFPGTSAQSVQKMLSDVVADPAVAVTFKPEDVHESAASPLRADVMTAVTNAVHARHPNLAIVPWMSPGATDGRYFRAAGVPTYAVSGLFIKPSDDFAHGLNERVPLAAIDGAQAHWESLIRELAR